MQFEEKLCFAFNILPSKIAPLVWSVTYSDVRYKLKMTYSEKIVEYTQQLETLAYVVSSALGGSSKKEEPKPTANWQEAQLQILGLFG